MSKRTRRFGKHSHNPNKVLRRASLDYSNTHRQFATYLENSLNDLLSQRAHVQFTRRPVEVFGVTVSQSDGTQASRIEGHAVAIKPQVTQLIIRALAPGEECADFEEAKAWLFDLATALKLGQDVGKIEIVPSGHSTQITVTKY